ncbi:MAG: FkbM family methyltransferase [Hyphomonadaceae bacterium]
MHDASSAFFSCRFLYTCEEIPGPEPFIVFEDEQSDPFARELVEACRGRAGDATRDADGLKGFQGLVFVEAPVWHRNWKRLLETGVPAQNFRTLLYFDCDPSGYWDFAKSCGKSLGAIFRGEPLNAAALQDVSPFLERWVAGQPFGGRFTSLVGFATGDYRARLIENGQAIARVMAALSDDESRTTYARILFGTEEDIFASFAARVFGAQQYMDVLDLQPGERIVNCGVGRGWELPYFLCKMQGQGAVYNIDPTIVLESSPYGPFLESFKDRMSFFRLIAGVKDGEIELASTDSAMVVSGAGGGSGATTRYKMRSIDSMVRKGEIVAPTYLKMDVEGGEIFILQGAMETIRRHRPRLAVAIYHEPHHFWEYPLYLMEQLKDYRFFLRQYGYSRFETLLYCVPKEAPVAGTARRSPTVESAHLNEGFARFYLYDAEPRDFYFGKRRVLTRFEGASWEEGELKPAPRIEADNLIAVQENADEVIFVTDHLYEDGNRRLVFGVSTDDPTRVDWRFAQTIEADARCVPVGGLRKGAAVALVERKHTAIGVWDGGDSMQWPTVFHGDHDVFYAQAVTGGGYELYARDGEGVRIITVDQGGVPRADRKFPVDKPVRGAVTLTVYENGAARAAPALLLDAGSGVCELRALRGKGAEAVGAIALPPGKIVAAAVG